MLLFGNEKKLVLLLWGVSHTAVCESYFSMKKSYQKSLLKRRNGSFGDVIALLIATLGDCGLLTLVCTNYFFVLPNSADFPPSPERLTFLVKAVVQSSSFDRFDLWRVKTEIGSYITAFYKKIPIVHRDSV